VQTVFSPYPHRDSCDRARQLASRDLDGDLSELDARALSTHLQDCAECAEFTAAMGYVTARVRGSERLERAPAAPMVVGAPRRRRPSARRLLVAAAMTAATAAAAGAGAIVASQAQHGEQRTAHTTTIAELAPLDHQFRVIRENKLVLVLPPQPLRSPHRRGVLV
jgi:predicted anti-sigma-YlaC factor YlaD